MGFWFSQNIQRRLLLYVLQQISLFSNLDLTNLDVSLGTSSNVTFTDIDLEVSDINIPNIVAKSGNISNLTLQLMVSGGVHITSSGITFEISINLPEGETIYNSDLNSSLPNFLAKSIHDLTTSVIQFTTDQGSNFNIDEIDDIIEEESSESEPNSDSHVEEHYKDILKESEQKRPTRLRNMRNKVLNTILSKLTMNLNDITFLIVDENSKSIFNVHVDSIQLLTTEDTIRKIIISSFRMFAHLSSYSDKEYEQNNILDNTQPSMSESMYYSKLEGTSIYMSALETPLQYIQEDNEEEENNNLMSETQSIEEPLITINNINICFEGLTSVEYLEIHDLTLDIEHIDINLENVVRMKNPILNKIVVIVTNLANNKDNSTTSTQPASDVNITKYSAAYKRFIDEQLPKAKFLSYICVNKIYITLSNELALEIKRTYINQLDNMDYVVNMDYITTIGEGFTISKNEKPILRMIIKQKETLINISSALNITVFPEKVRSLSTMFNNSQTFFESFMFLDKKSPKRGYYRPNSHKISVNSEDISLSLQLDDFRLTILFDPLYFNSHVGSLTSNSISIIRHNKAQVSELVTLSLVKFTHFKNKIEQSSFSETFNETILNSHNFCTVKCISLKDSRESLENLYEILKNKFELANSLPPSQDKPLDKQKNTVKDKSSNLKKSVRILNSSGIIYKQSLNAVVIFEIDLIKWKIDNVLPKRNFGSLKGKHSKNLLAFLQDINDIIFHSSSLEIDRIVPNNKKKQTVLELIKPMDILKPVLYIQKKNNLNGDSCTKVLFRNVSLHYYSTWLDYFRFYEGDPHNNSDRNHAYETLPKGSINVRKDQIDLRFFESSLFLYPYRLNAVLVILLDQFTNNYDSTKRQINGISKTATLLLIDDLNNRKLIHESQRKQSLISLYYQEGFSEVGRLDITKVSVSNSHTIPTLSVHTENVELSLCADSFHTLVQLSMDLKYPETFPDGKKFRTELQEPLDVLKNINLDFFDNPRYDDSGLGTMEDNEPVHVIENFLDGDNKYEENSDPGSLYTHSAGTNITTVTDSKISDSISFHEDYIDRQNIIKTKYTGNDGRIKRNSSLDNDKIRFKLILILDQINIKLFDGYDWKFSRKVINETVHEISKEVDEINSLYPTHSKNNPTSIAEPLQRSVFDSIYISADTTKVSTFMENVTRDIQGMDNISKGVTSSKIYLYPSKSFRLLLKLENLEFEFFNFDVDQPSELSSKFSSDILNKGIVKISNFEIIDNVPTSTWNKFLSILRSETIPHVSDMLVCKFSMVRPIDYLQALDYQIDIQVAPLRLHVDQDTLDFFTRFLEFKDSRFKLIDDYPEIPYISRFSIYPVKICLDYKPKSIDYSGLRSGHSSEFMNFFVLDGAHIVLKNIVLYGINGFDELNTKLKEIWTPDITRKQLGGVVGGLAPIKDFITLGSDVKTFVTILMSDYKSGSQMTTSLKRNGNVFLKTTTGDFIKLGAKLSSGAQAMLENTEEILGGKGVSGRTYNSKAYSQLNEGSIDYKKLVGEDQLVGGSNPKIKNHEPSALVIEEPENGETQARIISLYADQPLDVHKGLEQAYHSLEKHLNIAYDTIWKTHNQFQEDSNVGARAAAVSVMKATPVAIIRPLIGVTEALSKTLQGLSNQVDKDNIPEMQDKYKSAK